MECLVIYKFKNKFYCYENLVILTDIDIDKVLVSNKISFSNKNYKYFIDYLNNDHKVS